MPSAMMIACLIVSMLSNSMTMFTRTLCWRKPDRWPCDREPRIEGDERLGPPARPASRPAAGRRRGWMADERHGLLAQPHHRSARSAGDRT